MLYYTDAVHQNIINFINKYFMFTIGSMIINFNSKDIILY